MKVTAGVNSFLEFSCSVFAILFGFGIPMPSLGGKATISLSKESRLRLPAIDGIRLCNMVFWLVTFLALALTRVVSFEELSFKSSS